MAEKKPLISTSYNLTGLKPDLPHAAPPDALERLVPQSPPQQLFKTAPVPPPEKKKGGRPKGPDKIKRSYYLTFNLSLFEEVRMNTIVNGRVMVKDDGETVDMALELLDYISSNPELGYLIKQARDNKR